ncbi:alpha/beta hydrolase [Ketogulonicigenium vulgare]|uniref:Alpha/beta hydrolase fold-3 domain protein n=1 Tax=Ketogulonicigenium vulgare (strain WSH-001) TaxID=759362 RepID=F9Y984_KETVW|nr:alpha/beta hydrolase [Ketogulonicigenium vulgare]ADO41575.1 Alpha/beta hydrolase fold-3 domain protein [Ketogulonicigenium vulgare Y25]AEM41301.1 Alpha/beta hydrolase fold-3 domain protein [Ketogulonicigenium vulgare WSH-001]ALJ81436.1 alpha/beta hydrolase [Ketogulonicigenium vulgare]ANW34155.1 alpha/beta hydrolase [Ketogulonicigenium vulgare]AOZ55034.1 Alpha/beta hydrolase fold-3 domain protein [Ketogulonicigenium vulgare]
MGIIPLDQVAEDARDMVRLYREAAPTPYADMPLPDARRAYMQSCALNGLPHVPLPQVVDHRIAVSGAEITIREYRPIIAGVLPAVLFLHGGGWVLGGLDTHDTICRHLAAQSGAAVFAVDYRLAPEHPFPIPYDDSVAALNWLIAQADALAIDPARLAFAGDSAGGNLAAALTNSRIAKPLAQVLLYPVTDLAQRAPSYTRVATGFSLAAAGMEWFIDSYAPAPQDRSDPRLSPLRGDIAAVPMFILTCGLDPLADEGIAYAEAAAQAGAEVEHIHLPHHAHGLFTSAGRITTGAVMLERVAQYLAARLAA